MEEKPGPLSAAERQARWRRARDVARRLGFVGRIEYRHASTTVGGAQYGLGVSIANDLLVVYADAFRRDVDPNDFSLEAILAHERGHQLLHRHERLRRLTRGRLSPVSEEVLASLLGSLIVSSVEDRDNLILKAAFELVQSGLHSRAATGLITRLRRDLERAL